MPNMIIVTLILLPLSLAAGIAAWFAREKNLACATMVIGYMVLAYYYPFTIFHLAVYVFGISIGCIAKTTDSPKSYMKRGVQYVKEQEGIQFN